MFCFILNCKLNRHLMTMVSIFWKSRGFPTKKGNLLRKKRNYQSIGITLPVKSAMDGINKRSWYRLQSLLWEAFASLQKEKKTYYEISQIFITQRVIVWLSFGICWWVQTRCVSFPAATPEYQQKKMFDRLEKWTFFNF